MSLNGNSGFWLTVMCPYRFIDCIMCTAVVGMAIVREVVHVGLEAGTRKLSTLCSVLL